MLLASSKNTPNLKSLPPFRRREGGGVGGRGNKKIMERPTVLFFSSSDYNT